MNHLLVQSRTDDSRTSKAVGRFPQWVSIVVILGTLLTLTGAVIGKVDPTLLTNGSPITEAAQVYADYMFARSIALAVMLLFFLVIKSRRMLACCMVLVALIQIVDIGDDLARGAFLLVPGLLVFAIVFLLGAQRLCGQPLWHPATWRDQESF